MLAVEAVKRWLGSHHNWLLILDNADDFEMVRAFIPPGKTGHVLLTTRARATGAMARPVEIQKMAPKEGARSILRRAKYIAENAPLDAASQADQDEAKAIAVQLDGLPLALDQAGVYIEETVCGLSGYLRRRHDSDFKALPDQSSRKTVLPASDGDDFVFTAGRPAAVSMAVKAAGVTFAVSMLERVIEERARGDYHAAASLRQENDGADWR